MNPVVLPSKISNCRRSGPNSLMLMSWPRTGCIFSKIFIISSLSFLIKYSFAYFSIFCFKSAGTCSKLKNFFTDRIFDLVIYSRNILAKMNFQNTYQLLTSYLKVLTDIQQFCNYRMPYNHTNRHTTCIEGTGRHEAQPGTRTVLPLMVKIFPNYCSRVWLARIVRPPSQLITHLCIIL